MPKVDMTEDYIQHQIDEPAVFDFSLYGLKVGVRIKGYLAWSKQLEDVSGVICEVHPKWIQIQKDNGRRTSIHCSHLLGRKQQDVMLHYEIVGGKK